MASVGLVKARLLDASELERLLRRLGQEIIEPAAELDRLALVGLQTRGVFLARRIAAWIAHDEGHSVPVGALDVTLYRDDLRLRPGPRMRPTELPFTVEDRMIVLVDDVLHTGRTVRAAMDALLDYGRPAAIQLAVLIDRGGRELPICADYVGRRIPTTAQERIRVALREVDAEDAVYLLEVSP
ncbi:MAG: bifunctional pyr operon transcriptional regulator/uracil phosphoribosyltransferase PyrR [Bacteroidetes bacterium]|nr:bifunctional pyr operon transcriptional regulator/uracil phosphoribosyltransferase PyrR [Rhodothermia bacterium]MCS7155465.1 bifunctional pyr operon transcriptional regulator/uracil phosphoribosyltransferase PyrR [Bacteroidota bacterium]MCX7907442.1 bifunctional pyr operon transcriptional regulator/uracil phosphoribosyltransferase PyrR [Bacteroidota bacterium]MDW8138436.1 bifunctional pyr operon transcriptional regulator/uracil phosphoribosyltransferase PyrR [Bacteroidota bacterium]MDW828462